MLDLDILGYLVVGLCALMIGAAKTGVPGLGILVVPLMATVLPARNSVGVLLGILILADLFAVVYHRDNAKWGHILRLLPATLAGILAGWLALGRITNEQLAPIIGVIVLIMLTINYWRTRLKGDEAPIPTQWWFATALGFMAGLTSMMANAAGPIMIIYLLAMRLPKVAFVGTTAWFFFIVNWLKVPFSTSLDLMTWPSVKLNLMMLPVIGLGALAGVFVLKRIGQKAFNAVVQVLAAAAAVKLLF